MLVMVAEDVHNSFFAIRLCLSRGKCSLYKVSNVLLLLGQAWQASLMIFISWSVMWYESHVLGTLLNFAAVLIVKDLDNHVGRWFLTQMTPLDGMLEVSLPRGDDSSKKFLALRALVVLYVPITLELVDRVDRANSANDDDMHLGGWSIVVAVSLVAAILATSFLALVVCILNRMCACNVTEAIVRFFTGPLVIKVDVALSDQHSIEKQEEELQDMEMNNTNRGEVPAKSKIETATLI